MKDLTHTQMLFISLSQSKYYEILLSPYIDHTPSPEALENEAARMAEIGRTIREEGGIQRLYNKPIPADYDGTKSMYDD